MNRSVRDAHAKTLASDLSWLVLNLTFAPEGKEPELTKPTALSRPERGLEGAIALGATRAVGAALCVATPASLSFVQPFIHIFHLP